MPRGVYKHKKGPDSPFYKGDNVTEGTGRWRAGRLYPGPLVCSIDGCGAVGQRHHVDGNTANNSPDNIQIVCAKHHVSTERRNEWRKGYERSDLTDKGREAIRANAAGVCASRKGKPHSESHNTAVSIAIKKWWARRKGLAN